MRGLAGRSSIASGFSLVELLVVMAVLGILAGAVMPLAELGVRRERERELKRALWEIRDAIDAYKRAGDAGLFVPPTPTGYPPSLEALVAGVNGTRGERLHFLRRIPRDPFAPEGVEAAQSWALRSHRSPPDRPAPGDDVYDVRSRAPGRGLNGVALEAW